MATGLVVVGFANPASCLPTFCVPLFRFGDALVVQNVGPFGRVQEFSRSNLVVDLAIDEGDARAVRVGDAAVYAFAFPDGSVAMGTREELGSALATREDVSSLHPLLRLEICEFRADFDGASRVISEVESLWMTSEPRWAREWASVERKGVERRLRLTPTRQDELVTQGESKAQTRLRLRGALLRLRECRLFGASDPWAQPFLDREGYRRELLASMLCGPIAIPIEDLEHRSNGAEELRRQADSLTWAGLRSGLACVLASPGGGTLEALHQGNGIEAILPPELRSVALGGRLEPWLRVDETLFSHHFGQSTKLLVSAWSREQREVSPGPAVAHWQMDCLTEAREQAPGGQLSRERMFEIVARRLSQTTFARVSPFDHFWSAEQPRELYEFVHWVSLAYKVSQARAFGLPCAAFVPRRPFSWSGNLSVSARTKRRAVVVVARYRFPFDAVLSSVDPGDLCQALATDRSFLDPVSAWREAPSLEGALAALSGQSERIRRIGRALGGSYVSMLPQEPRITVVLAETAQQAPQLASLIFSLDQEAAALEAGSPGAGEVQVPSATVVHSSSVSPGELEISMAFVEGGPGQLTLPAAQW